MFSQHFASLKEGRQGFFNSSLFVLRQPCLGKIIFSSCTFFVLYLGHVCTLMSILSEHWIFITFAVLWHFFSFGYCLFSGGIFLFSVVFVGGDLCVFYLLHLSLVCLFWACEFLEVSLAGRVIFSFLRGAPLCGVSGRYYLFEC
jgi:hypothetical protein